MIRLTLLWSLLCLTTCREIFEDDKYRVTNITLDANKPLTLPELKGTHVVLKHLSGTLHAASLSRLNVTDLELHFERIDEIEPGALCSSPSLKSLSLYVGKKPITVTRETLKNCQDLESLIIGEFYFSHSSMEEDAATDLPKLKTLTLLGIHFGNLTRNNFRHLRALQHLILQECKVEEIAAEAFQDLAELQELEISPAPTVNTFFRNKVKVNSLTFEGFRGTLQRASFTVAQLHLRSYDLAEIEPGAVCSSASLKRFKLEFQAVQMVEITRETLQNCEDLEELVLKGTVSSVATRTRTNTFHGLANLRKLSLEQVKIDRLSKDTFKDSVALEGLSLIDNYFREVDGDAFSNFARLKEVKIRLLASPEFNFESLFKNGVKVEKLTLGGLRGKLFTPQLHVNELHLIFDDLEELEGAICASVKKFGLKIDRHDNVTLTKESLNCQHLEELSLSGSRREPPQIQVDAFNNLSNLKVLQLDNFNFTRVKRSYFRKLASLERLVLSACFVAEFDNDAFDDLKFLKVLQISDNFQFKHLPENLFTKNSQLEKLLLFNNQIAELTWDEFKGLSALTTLSLRENPIRSFDAEKIAQNVPSLKRFDIVWTFKRRKEYFRFVEELRKRLESVEFAVFQEPFV